VRIDAEVVVALAPDLGAEPLQYLHFSGEPSCVTSSEVAPVQPDLAAALQDRPHEPGSQALVHLGRRPVVAVAVPGEQEEGRGRPVLALGLHQLAEAPVGVGAAQPVERHAGERARLAGGRPAPPSEDARLEPRRGPLDPEPRPAPGHVHVVREGDGEARSAPAPRLEPEPASEPVERRVERIEARGRRGEPAVLVARPVELLDAGQVEERVREVVLLRALAALDRGPCLGDVRDVGAE